MKNHFYSYLKSLSKDELIDLIYKKKTHIKTLDHKSIRTIALRISYIGEKYNGLAPYIRGNTIGNHIENALNLSGLGTKVTYAGRTDAGVSAAEMVASLEIKSRLSSPKNAYDLCPSNKNEFKYDVMLNNYLPKDIRITGWAPVPKDFSARFSCIQRQYKYYFCKDGLDINRMKEMCKRIQSMTNFYDLSKHSDHNAKYERHLDVCEIVDDGMLAYLDVRARSFLHNMVRKIFFVVQKYGKCEEVDFSKVGLASPLNLLFFKAVYPENLNFISNMCYDRIFYDDMVESQVQFIIKKEIHYLYNSKNHFG